MVTPACDGDPVIPEFDQCYRAVEAKDDPLRRVVLHCGQDDRDLLPSELPGAHALSEERRVLPDRGPRPSGPGTGRCKRCRPDASPGSPEWDPRGDVIARAMRLIGDGVVDREGVSGLADGSRTASASSTGSSSASSAPVRSRSLGRSAAQTARGSSRRRNLRFADVAFAAGFASIRQFKRHDSRGLRVDAERDAHTRWPPGRAGLPHRSARRPHAVRRRRPYSRSSHPGP